MPRNNLTQRSSGYPKAPVQVERMLRAASMHKPEIRQLVEDWGAGSGRQCYLSSTLLRDLYNAWDALRPPKERELEPDL